MTSFEALEAAVVNNNFLDCGEFAAPLAGSFCFRIIFSVFLIGPWEFGFPFYLSAWAVIRPYHRVHRYSVKSGPRFISQ